MSNGAGAALAAWCVTLGHGFSVLCAKGDGTDAAVGLSDSDALTGKDG